jgi:hypothetical protein
MSVVIRASGYWPPAEVVRYVVPQFERESPCNLRLAFACVDEDGFLDTVDFDKYLQGRSWVRIIRIVNRAGDAQEPQLWVLQSK